MEDYHIIHLWVGRNVAKLREKLEYVGGEKISNKERLDLFGQFELFELYTKHGRKAIDVGYYYVKPSKIFKTGLFELKDGWPFLEMIEAHKEEKEVTIYSIECSESPQPCTTQKPDMVDINDLPIEPEGEDAQAEQQEPVITQEELEFIFNDNWIDDEPEDDVPEGQEDVNADNIVGQKIARAKNNDKRKVNPHDDPEDSPPGSDLDYDESELEESEDGGISDVPLEAYKDVEGSSEDDIFVPRDVSKSSRKVDQLLGH